MPAVKHPSVYKKRQAWLLPVGALVMMGVTTFLILFGADHLARDDRQGFFSVFREFDVDTVQNGLANVAAIVAAVMGIVITVVSIIVQLSANRYSPQVTEMFFKDRTNLVVMAFYVEACVLGLWVTFMTTRTYVPQISIIALLVVATIGFLIMAPYFAYVFSFLSPENVINRIQHTALDAAITGAAQQDAERRDTDQARVLQSMEQITDIARNAIGSKDKIIATGCVDALKQLAVRYLASKRRSLPAWHAIGPRLRANPDFVSMTPESLKDLESRQVWLEWKLLRQYQAMYNEALTNMRDLNYVLAIDTRYIAEAAVRHEEPESFRMAVKFFNTYLRATLNARDIRTAYNILNQYRMLAETLLRAKEDDLALEIAGYLKYYGHIGYQLEMPFVTEVVAYDISTMLELAHDVKSSVEGKLLAILLQVDREGSSGDVDMQNAEESSLRGVRKAQAKLATYYLERKEEALAREVFRDMEHERPERLRGIRDELMKVDSRDFWEVNDRWVNFDYLPPARRALLATFFEWFPEIDRRSSGPHRAEPSPEPPSTGGTAKV